MGLLAFALWSSMINFVLGSCQDWDHRCTATLGTPLKFSDSNAWFSLAEAQEVYFEFASSHGNSVDIEIISSNVVGSVEIFVAKGIKKPTSTSYDYSSLSEGLTDMLIIDKSTIGTITHFSCLVRAVTQSKISLLVSDEDTKVHLLKSMPQKDITDHTSVSQFLYSLPAHTTDQFLISLTHLTGINDIQLTAVNERTQEQYTPSISNNAIIITPENVNQVTDYSIHVTTNGSASFLVSVLPHGSTDFTLLLVGQPLIDVSSSSSSSASTSSYYKLETTAGEEEIIISVTSLTGDVSLFVGTELSGFGPSSALWSSSSIVKITKSSVNYLHDGGYYLITVVAPADTEFSISGFSANSVLTLAENRPFFDSVSAFTYHYYRFYDSNPEHSMLFVLTSLSGNADVYIGCQSDTTGDDTGYPSKLIHHYNFSSTSTLQDSLYIYHLDKRSCNRFGNVFYVSVYAAATSSSFSLLAYHYGGSIHLYNGVPQSGVVYRMLGQWYVFSVGPEAEAFSVTLTTVTGDADLYARLSTSPNTISFDYSSTKMNLLLDSISIPESSMCTNCFVFIYVLGYQPSTYTILGKLTDTVVVLRDAVPFLSHVQNGLTEYYSLSIASDGVAQVILTQLVGSVGLAASLVTTMPNVSHPTAHTAISDDGDYVPHVYLLNAHSDDILHIGVTGIDSNASFVIEAFLIPDDGSHVMHRLIEGVPLAGVVSSGVIQYYQFSVFAGHDTLKIVSSDLIGDVDLYGVECVAADVSCLSNLPSPSNFQWASSTSASQEVLEISRMDQVASTFIFSLVPTNAFSEYVISAQLESTVLTLIPGISVSDHVSKSKYSYFKFAVPEPFDDVTFTVTSISGDPDIFISTMNRHPSIGNHTWLSFHYGSDTVTIKSSDASACYDCWFYVGIYGYQDSTYTIIGTLLETVAHLRDGFPQNGAVVAYQLMQFVFYDTFGTSRDVTVTATPILGDVDIYVTIDSTEPSLTNFQYSSVNSWYSTDIVKLIHNDAVYASQCADGDCELRVGVYGMTPATFSIAVTSEFSSLLLQPGIPIMSLVAQYSSNYYRVVLSLMEAALKISFSVSSGHGKAYVSCKTRTPTSSSSQWHLDSATGTVMTISPDDASDHGCIAPVTFYIAVYGVELTYFTIVAREEVEDGSATILPNGNSITDSVPHQSFDYFVFYWGSEFFDVEISLTASAGNADLYISYSFETRAVYNSITNRVEGYSVSSYGMANDHVVLRHGDINQGCTHVGRISTECYVVIGVFGSYDGVSYYQILASLLDATKRLVSSIPVSGFVNHYGYDYYTITINQPLSDLIISITPFSGDPDLYIGNLHIHHPTRSNYTWSMTTWGDDTITLQADSLDNYCHPDAVEGIGCPVYIGVYGFSNSSYYIVATVSDGWANPILLLEGTPQTGYVLAGEFRYFRYNVAISASKTSSIQFTLTTEDGGDADLYISFDGSIEPGMTHFDYRSIGWGGSVDQIVVSSTMAHYCKTCTIYVAVYGWQAASFSLVASTHIVQLREGIPQSDVVKADIFHYYSFTIQTQAEDVTVRLTALTSDPDLYITTGQNHLPSRNDYLWRSAAVGSDEILIDHTDPNFCFNCDYTIGVYGWRNSSYSIVYTSHVDSIIRLASGRPQQGQVSQGGKKYFRTTLANTAESLTLSLTTLSGSADLYVSVATAGQADDADEDVLPDPLDPSTYSWSTSSSARDFLFIQGPFQITGQATFTITVYGLETSEFSIVAAFSENLIQLQDGVPQHHYVDMSSTARFVYDLTEIADLSVSVTAVSGDPDVFISTRHRDPGCFMAPPGYFECTNFTWMSSSYSTDQIYITHDLPCTATSNSMTINRLECDTGEWHIGPVYIGVFGFRASSFNIVASKGGQHIRLVAGHQQAATTHIGFACSHRSDNGDCDGSSSHLTEVQAAYFSFQVSADDLDSDDHVSVYVKPQCNTTAHESQACQAGCECNPLTLFVSSCHISSCLQDNKYPSQYNSLTAISHIIHQSGTSIFISYDKLNSDNGFCDPSSGEACVYFFGLMHANYQSQASFSIQVSTPKDVSLLPCDTAPKVDGVRLEVTMASRGSEMMLYEMCSSISDETVSTESQLMSSKELVASDHDFYKYPEDLGIRHLTESAARERILIYIESCSADQAIYICDTQCENSFPTSQEYIYFSDGSKSCKRTDPSVGNDHCIDGGTEQLNGNQYPWIEINPKLDVLFPDSNNYYIGIVGSGTYLIKAQTTLDGDYRAPMLVSAASSGHPIQFEQAESRLQVTFPAARIWVPSIVPVLSHEGLVAEDLEYIIYFIDDSIKDQSIVSDEPVLHTICGLDIYAMNQRAKVEKIIETASNSSSSVITISLSNIKPKTTYSIVVAARCDSNCLKQFSRSTGKEENINCNSASGCSEIRKVLGQWSYESTDFEYSDDEGTLADDENVQNSISSEVKTALVAVSLLVMLTIAGVIYTYYRMRLNLSRDQYAVVHVSGPPIRAAERRVRQGISIRREHATDDEDDGFGSRQIEEEDDENKSLIVNDSKESYVPPTLQAVPDDKNKSVTSRIASIFSRKEKAKDADYMKLEMTDISDHVSHDDDEQQVLQQQEEEEEVESSSSRQLPLKGPGQGSIFV